MEKVRTQRGQETGFGRVHTSEKFPVAGQAKDVKEQGSIIQLKMFVVYSSPAPNLQM